MSWTDGHFFLSLYSKINVAARTGYPWNDTVSNKISDSSYLLMCCKYPVGN